MSLININKMPMQFKKEEKKKRKRKYFSHAIRSIEYVMSLGHTPACFISARISTDLRSWPPSPVISTFDMIINLILENL